MFAIKSSLPYEVLPTPPSVEVLSISVGFSNPTVYCLVTSLPDNYWLQFSNYIESLNNISSNIVLLSGDINWSSLSSKNQFSQKFCDVLFELNLFQLIDEPSHSAGNILDLVLTNIPENISNLIIHSEPPHSIPSDHFVITFDYSSNSHTSNSVSTKIFNFPKGNYDDLCNFLVDHDFSSYYTSEDIGFTETIL